MIAFVAGLAIGNLIGHSGGGDESELATIGVDDGAGGNRAPAEPGAAPSAPPADGETVRLRAEVPEGAPQRGPDDALVTIVMWSDFECPFCQRVEPTLTRLVNEHGNDIRVVWRNNPLPFHQNAGPAAQAAMEAMDQGGNEKFWAMHSLLFENRTISNADASERYRNSTEHGAVPRGARQQQAPGVVQAGQRLRSRSARPGTNFFISSVNLRGAQPLRGLRPGRQAGNRQQRSPHGPQRHAEPGPAGLSARLALLQAPAAARSRRSRSGRHAVRPSATHRCQASTPTLVCRPVRRFVPLHCVPAGS
ncbi:MAG: thioredoxin domain-containing protein [Sandaracinaceae bacterium]